MITEYYYFLSHKITLHSKSSSPLRCLLNATTELSALSARSLLTSSYNMYGMEIIELAQYIFISLLLYHPGQATAAAQESGISHTSAGGSSARKFEKLCHIQLATHGTPFM